MPPWVQEGGYDDWAERLRNPEIRAGVAREMVTPTDEWENLMRAAGPDGTLLVGFMNPDLRAYAGRTLAEVAEERGTSPQETAMDLVIEDGSRVQVVYFLMSEENVMKQIALPWVSFDSDAGSMAPEPPFSNFSTHPALISFRPVTRCSVTPSGLPDAATSLVRISVSPAPSVQRTLVKVLIDLIMSPPSFGPHSVPEAFRRYALRRLHASWRLAYPS